MTWSVLVNGEVFDKWESGGFSRSLDNNCGKFDLVITNMMPRELPIQGNDEVQIFIDNVLVFTGFVNRISDKGSLSGSTIDIGGEDKTCDLVDSSVPDAVKNKKGSLTLKQMCELMISALGLDVKVIDLTSEKIGNKVVSMQKTADVGEKCASFLAKMAAKLQVWLVTDEESNLVIMRAGEVSSDMDLYYLRDGQGLNNVLDASFDIDLRQVFNKVKVRGQKSLGFNADSKNADDFIDLNGSNFDLDARPSRYLEIKAKENMTANELRLRAIDEVNYRRGQAYKYKPVINTFFSPSKQIIRIGDLHFISDDIRDVTGKMIVKSFDVSFDISGGTKVSLEMAPKEAYQIVDLDLKYQKLNAMGKKVRKQKRKNNG